MHWRLRWQSPRPMASRSNRTTPKTIGYLPIFGPWRLISKNIVLADMAFRVFASRGAALLAFLFLFHLAVAQDRPLFVAAACFAAAGLQWIGRWRGRNSSVYGWVYAIGGVVAALTSNVSDLVALAPALGYLLAMTVFGRTLMPGVEPLITTYCRLAFGYVP